MNSPIQEAEAAAHAEGHAWLVPKQGRRQSATGTSAVAGQAPFAQMDGREFFFNQDAILSPRQIPQADTWLSACEFAFILRNEIDQFVLDARVFMSLYQNNRRR
jgi:hypothetical protein